MSHPQRGLPALKRSIIALSMAAGLSTSASAFADAPYSQTIFFGDSLTDGGFFRPLLPASVRPVTGQFTTNPGLVWSQYLADFYGTTAEANGNGQTGTNYAAGGARNGINSTGALGPIPSLTTQINNYLASTGGVADANALYTVWGGANDLFAITNAGADPTTTIASAVGSQVGNVSALTNAGAQYVLVLTVPDLGVTPAFRALGPAAQAQGTALTVTYNNALFSALASNGLRVIPVDTFRLIQEITADPSRYGFTNITGTACQPQITANSLTCNPTSYVNPNAPNDYLFADGVHPTSRAHSILSEHVIGVLEAPRQIGLLPQVNSLLGKAQSDRLLSHAHGKGRGEDGSSWWVDVSMDSQKVDEADTPAGAAYDGSRPSLGAGMDWKSGSLAYGVFAGFGQGDFDFAPGRGGYEQQDLSIGGHIGWYGESFWINALGSYSRLSFDVERVIPLGPTERVHSGSPDGSNLTFAFNAGYEFKGESLTHGPYVGVVAQRIDVDAYDEDGATLSTALGYLEQSHDSTVASIGWQGHMRTAGGTEPYARVSWNKELDDPQHVFARSLTITSALPYTVPVLALDEDYATVSLGVRTELFGMDADINVGFNSRNDSTDTALNVRIGKSF